ncbi:MAG: type I pullulanase [Prevotella sp.]|nr:type I pullulanase [Prevotella sp.]
MAAVAVPILLACDPPKDAAFVFDEVTYSPQETVFKVFAPESPYSTSDRSGVCVVVDGDSIPMVWKPTVDDTRCIYKAVVKGDLKGKTYEFVVNGQASPGVFAKAVTINGQKGVVVDMRDTDPDGWDQDRPVRRPYQDIVVYEMHHRDFSVGRADAQHPGKFLALTEPWALQHLQDLGINAVHILPSYDYGSVDETRLDQPQYNWGYDPVNYNVPEGSYSTDPSDPQCRIREFKQMVQALHQAGIAVILDVVYNHTYDIEHSNFQRTYPNYYYRTSPSPSQGGESSSSPWGRLGEVSYSNGSGCGNETASEQEMMRRFMIESVKYWVSEYHIDGFRFDLMGVHDIETMNQIRQALDDIDPLIFMYGEGWSAGDCALPREQLAMKANIPQMPRIAAFSDDMRDALRGPFSDDTKPGWLAAPFLSEGVVEAKESLKAGIAGMIEHPQVDYSLVNYSDAPFALEPTQMMAYVSCHDDMCLVDRLKASIPGLQNSSLISLDLLAQTAVFTSQGVPFMLSGEELLRTKQGVHNSFESPDSINRLDWQNKERYPQVFDYYKHLIALRLHHPAFRLGSAHLVRRHLEFLDTAPCVVAYRLKDHAGGDEWQDIIVILNVDRQSRMVDIPAGQYRVVCCDGQIDESGLGEVSGSRVQVAPQSALILCH